MDEQEPAGRPPYRQASSINNELSNVELVEILNVLHKYHGFDFSNYAKSSLKRRIIRYMHKYKIANVLELKHFLINSPDAFHDFVQNITVNVTEMFRDPAFFIALKNEVFPTLATYPSIKIWHAGCATGEEVYSMAILLYEAGLLAKTQLYATDINMEVLEKAKQGMLPLRLMQEYTQNYIRAGGKSDFSNYYTARYDSAILNKDLKQKIVFTFHNLVSDGSFNEFNLILCRNVLIYFDRHLQNKIISLFNESLCTLGFLALGNKETLLFMDSVKKYNAVNQNEKIFQRVY